MHEFIHSRLTSLSRGLRKTFFRGRTDGGLHAALGSRHSSLLLSIIENLRSPGTIGAACRSSAILAHCMAQCVDPDSNGYVVELGGGTGPVTAALLTRGIAPERLIVIEQSPKLSRHLQRRFPAVRVVCGNAEMLPGLLGNHGPVSSVVSSLPLRSLKADAVRTIVDHCRTVLSPGGVVVQFTYALWGSSPLAAPDCEKISSRVVWRNFPPARVDVFTRRVDAASSNLV
jgi:phosphatidylethanolamine/phosphatidyl-N-methylethanolamine N-methyltransferase